MKENEIKLSTIIIIMNISISNKNFSLLLFEIRESRLCGILDPFIYSDWYSMISMVELLC